MAPVDTPSFGVPRIAHVSLRRRMLVASRWEQSSQVCENERADRILWRRDYAKKEGNKASEATPRSLLKPGQWATCPASMKI